MKDRRPVDRILEDWSAVANQARRPAAAPRPVVVRSGLSTGTLAGATLVVVAIVAAGLWLGRSGPSGIVGGDPSPTPNLTTAPLVTPTAPLATPSPPPSTGVAPSASPTIGPCGPTNLSARITMWEGAAGHRTAHVELTNSGASSCTVRTMAKPQLVDGDGAVLIDGSNPPASESLTLAPGGGLQTLVQDGNYCGSAPTPPVRVAFVLSDGGRIVAAPVSLTDATVPPCLGTPGSQGTIEMQPWAPR